MSRDIDRSMNNGCLSYLRLITGLIFIGSSVSCFGATDTTDKMGFQISFNIMLSSGFFLTALESIKVINNIVLSQTEPEVENSLFFSINNSPPVSAVAVQHHLFRVI